MSRILIVPGVLCLVAFCLVYLNQAQSPRQELEQQDDLGQTAAPSTKPSNVDESGVEVSELMTWKDARRQLVKDWPVDTGFAGGSRAGVSRTFSVHVPDLPSEWDDRRHNFLTTFFVQLMGRSSEYPVCVNRATKSIYIYDSRQWLEYETWKADKLPQFSEQANGRGETTGGGRGGLGGGEDSGGRGGRGGREVSGGGGGRGGRGGG